MVYLNRLRNVKACFFVCYNRIAMLKYAVLCLQAVNMASCVLENRLRFGFRCE